MKIIVTCDSCGKEMNIRIEDLEEYIYSDSHDPDEDYIKCDSYNCNNIMNITNNHKDILLEDTEQKSFDARVYSDTCDLFIVYDGEEYRVAELISGGEEIGI